MADDTSVPVLELADIQSGVLRPRPSPYAATYILLRIDEARAGRELLRRLSDIVTSAAWLPISRSTAPSSIVSAMVEVPCALT